MNSLEYISFEDNMISSTIPDAICDLSLLSQIYFSTNLIQGSLPYSIGKLTNLVHINLAENQISGSIPQSITEIITLTELDVFTNLMTGTEKSIYMFSLTIYTIIGTIPSGLIYILSIYDCEDNFFTGTVPSNISITSQFKVTNNYLSGSILSTTALQIQIDKNYFTGKAVIAENCPLYQISFNYFSGKIPLINSNSDDYYGNDNYFSGKLISISSDTIITMEYYILQNNMISGSITDEFWNIIVINNPLIRFIRLDGNELTGQISNQSIFSDYNSNFHTLNLGNNFLTGTLTCLICDLTDLSTIKTFQINNNYFTGSLCQYYPSGWSIQIFNVASNSFTGFILNPFQQVINSIQSLLIGYNLFSGMLEDLIPNSLLENQNLIQLDLGYNVFTGTIPSSYGNFLELVSLSLGLNVIDGTIPFGLNDLTNLRLLDITGLMMCYNTSLARAVLGASEGNLYRCQDMQDIAACNLRYNTEIYSSISNLENEFSKSYESKHLYDSNTDQVEFIYVANAIYFTIVFDDWSRLEYPLRDELYIYYWYDYIEFCYDIKCIKKYGKYAGDSFPGINNIDPLIIPANSFYVHFISDSSLEYWGYYFTATAVITRIGWTCIAPPNISFPLSTDVIESYNLTLNQSYAVDFCGNEQWQGITCTNGVVTALTFDSYGIPGTIPSIISLFSNLEELDFTYNSLTGTIPSTLFNLNNLKIIDFSNNKISGTMTSSFGQLSNIEEIKLFSNFISGTLPESLCLTNKSLEKLLLSGNKLTGKLENSLCSLSNAVIDVSGNDLTCYESCWVSATTLKSNLDVCAPTNYPTSIPTAPTFQPTINKIGNNKYNWYYILIIGIVILLGILVGAFYYVYFHLNSNSKERKINLLRENTLEKLPIHRFIVNGESEETILQMIKYSCNTLCSRDYDGNTVIDLAINKKLSCVVITEILKQLLLMHTGDHNECSPTLSQNFIYAWIQIVQLDAYVDSIQSILDEFLTITRVLSDCADDNGRLAVNIASPICRKVIKESLYFLRRYDFGNSIYPTHVSENSVVYIVTDTHLDDVENNKVAIKFMSDVLSFENEIRSRQDISIGCDSIIPILETFTSESNSLYTLETKKRQLEKYKFCIVMPAGEKTLANIIATERIAGKDFQSLQSITIKLVKAINDLHIKSYIHGDLKPLNVMRKGNDIVLIDLDASAKVGNDIWGSKYSQAYIPPEMIYKNDEGKLIVRSINSLNSSIKLFFADYSQDCWSLGMLLYELYTGVNFFLKDSEDIIDDESLQLLYDFDETFKSKKLERIPDKLARNLVSLLLIKDPSKRISMTRVLEHPFLTNKSTPRLVGEEAEYDVFISYRVCSDENHAKEIYDLLIAEGLNVWWDKKSLLSGVNWEKGFCEGLMKSRIFIPIISKNSINNPNDHRFNISMFNENSRCDNVLLEYELALECHQRGLISCIYPILVGDFDVNKNEYLDYFANGCYPSRIKNVIVKSIDNAVKNHLNVLGLGSRLIDNTGTKNTLESILKCQGYLVKGSNVNNNIFRHIVDDVKSMISHCKNQFSK